MRLHPLSVLGSSLFVLSFVVPFYATAQSVEPEEFAIAEVRTMPLPPLRLADRATAPSFHVAPALETAAEELESIREWNRSRREPTRIGFTRPLQAARVDLSLSGLDEGSARTAEPAQHAGGLLAKSAEGEWVWGARVEVADAYRLRLHLTDVDLPVGTQLWVYGEGNEVVPFGLELLSEDDRSLWTPSVGGGSIRLEVRLPRGAGAREGTGFTLGELAEIFPLDSTGRPLAGFTPRPRAQDLTCLVDAQCVTPATFANIDFARRATAHLQYVIGSSVAICTGGLLNDTVDNTFVPWLQTANHCISTQAVANTLEAFWDYHTPVCNGAFPSLSGLPRSSGAQLATTGQSSDFSLLRLNSIPPNRSFLGWNANANAAPNGTVLHRVSHPMGFPQAYSRTVVQATGPQCSGLERPRFIHQRLNGGGVQGGSSGAPVLLANSQMVGQLLGVCGPNTAEGCDAANNTVDGAFSTSFASEAVFLAGNGIAQCVPGPTTLCLHNNRFRIEVDWESASDNGKGAVLSKLSDSAGVFYFFNSNNAEMLIKVLRACTPFNRYWVFYAATTNVDFTVRVSDTLADVTKDYHNSLGQLAQPIQDTQAFATCP